MHLARDDDAVIARSLTFLVLPSPRVGAIVRGFQEQRCLRHGR